jgi:hypothetical protein
VSSFWSTLYKYKSAALFHFQIKRAVAAIGEGAEQPTSQLL